MNGLGCMTQCQGLQTWGQGAHRDAPFGMRPGAAPSIDIMSRPAFVEAPQAVDELGEPRGEGFLAFADRILNDKRTWYFAAGFALGVKLCRRFQ